MESDESEDEDEDGVKPSTRRALSAAGIEPPKVRTPIAHFKACAMVARIIFQFKDQVPIDEDCAEEEEAEDQDNDNQVCPQLDLNLINFTFQRIYICTVGLPKMFGVSFRTYN